MTYARFITERFKRQRYPNWAKFKWQLGYKCS